MIKAEWILFCLAVLCFILEWITFWGGFGIASYALLLMAYGTDLYNREEE